MGGKGIGFDLTEVESSDILGVSLHSFLDKLLSVANVSFGCGEAGSFVHNYAGSAFAKIGAACFASAVAGAGFVVNRCEVPVDFGD